MRIVVRTSITLLIKRKANLIKRKAKCRDPDTSEDMTRDSSHISMMFDQWSVI